MKRVLIGMSGGVDSSVAAYLLKEQGYEVVGLTMSLFVSNSQEGCTSSSVIEDAKKVCDRLGIEHHILDLKQAFKSHVIDNFINSYLNAETPNPCVECNKFLKFGLMWEEAKKLNCDYIATGHYASIKDNKLCKIDSPKDQTYFLYKINKDLLSHILFPLQDFTDKDKIRDIARTIGLEVSDKKDSQDICFIEGEYTNFLEQNIDKLPAKGNFILKDGTIVGQHKGIIYYTIGQRKGLGLSYHHPLYVVKIDVPNNKVILGKEEDLYSKKVYITDTNILVDNLPYKAQAKIRYKSNPISCTYEIIDDNNMIVIFDEPVKSVTPGQSLVLYDNDILLGGGIITNEENN